MSTEGPSLRRQAVHGTLWFGGSRVITQAISWLITILVVRLLTPDDYGLFGFATLVAGLVDLIAELGLGAAIIQKRDLDDTELETVFWLSLASSVAAYAVIWLAAPAISTFFMQPQLMGVLRLSMLAFIISSARVVSWNLLTKRVDFKRRSVAELIATLSGSMATLMLAYAGWGVWALVTGQIVRQTVLTVSCTWMFPWWPRGRFGRGAAGRVFGFGATVSGERVTWYLSSNADFLVVGKLLGQQALGFYTLVFEWATLPADRITSVINQVAFPVYARLQNQPESFTRFFLKTVTLVSLVTFPAMAGLLAVADVAIPALLTAKWQPITEPLQIMGGVGMVMSISALIAPAVLAKGKPGLILKFSLLCLVLLPAGFLVGSRFGLVGVCWAWMLLYPIVVCVWFSMTRRLIGYEWGQLLSALTPASVCTASMSIVLSAASFATAALSASLWRLLLLIGAGVLSYVLVLVFGFRRQVDEIRELVFARG